MGPRICLENWAEKYRAFIQLTKLLLSTQQKLPLVSLGLKWRFRVMDKAVPWKRKFIISKLKYSTLVQEPVSIILLR